MSQYPVFSGSPFQPNTNLLPFNLNQNLNILSHVSPFQQNANMSFLSFPPPSLPGSHHVFQNGPRFPGAINAMQPPIFGTNALGNPSMVASSAFATTIPNGNIISPLPFSSNSTLPTFTSVPPPPPQIIPVWKSTAFDHAQSPNFSNESSNLKDTGSLHGHFQQTPQKLNAQSLNPWSPAPSNNFQNSTSNTINPWVMDPSVVNSSFNTFQSESSTSNPTFQTSISPWVSDSNSSNFSHNFQGTTMQIKESPSKYRQSKSPASDINPWAQPVICTTGFSNDSYHRLSNEHGRHNQHNKFRKPNFNNQKSNSRYFSNNNYKRQDRSYKGEGGFKRETDESKPYSCDTCDRSFASEVEFQGHMADHIKCNFKNCHFEAHPKIVSLHKRMQHDTGYADAINKLKNADEIEKWRAERRRHFPTAANILKRKAEQAEKEARGEVIESKEFGKFKSQNTGQREQRNNRLANRKRGKKRRRMDAHASVTVSGSDSDDDSHIKLSKFSGILAVTDVFNPVSENSSSNLHSPEKSAELIENANSVSSKIKSLVPYACLSEESEEATLNSKEVESLDVSIKGSASSNPINIVSDDDAPIEFRIVKKQSNLNDNKESEDESLIEIPVSKVPLNEVPNSSPAVAKNIPFIDMEKGDTETDDDSPVEIPISKVPLNEISNSTSIVSNNKPPIDKKKAPAGRNASKAEDHRRNLNRKSVPFYVNPVRKSSLLEKLLADDIRHERNVVMQCIRHIVKKKFFGIGSDAEIANVIKG